MTYREEHTALSNHRIVALGKSLDKAVGVGLDSSFDDPLPLVLWRLVLVLSAKQTVLNVAGDGGGEKSRLLRDETDLRAKPADIQVLELDPIELDRAADRVAEDEQTRSASSNTFKKFPNSLEALEKADDCRFAGSRTSDELRGERRSQRANVVQRRRETSAYSGHLALGEDCVELVEHLDGGSGRVDKVDVLKLDDSLDRLGLETVWRSRVDDWRPVNGDEDGRGGGEGMGDGADWTGRRQKVSAEIELDD